MVVEAPAWDPRRKGGLGRSGVAPRPSARIDRSSRSATYRFDLDCPVYVDSRRPLRNDGPKVLWPVSHGSAEFERRLRRCMTDDDACPLVLPPPSADPMLADVARAGISRQQSQSIPSGISASRSEPRHLQPTAVGPLTFALSVRRGVVRC